MSREGEVEPARLRALVTEPEPCPYLPDRDWQSLVVAPPEPLDAHLHASLLDRGFRRMGAFLYRPACADCRACRSVRLDVRRFRPSRSQRRARNRNRDVDVVVKRPRYSEEKRALLERYLAARHEGPMTAEPDSMRQFMFSGSGHAREFQYRLEGRLIALGLFDLAGAIGSSLYFYFDPDESRRSLGTWSMIVEIEFTRRNGGRWFHPGFLIEGCPAMEYKRRFGPLEVLGEDGVWRPYSA